MNISLNRMWESSECIQGSLFIDRIFECYTLELPLLFDGRENVQGKTCIPAGSYLIQREFSHHFDQMMPMLVGVPGRSGVEIHVGNTAEDIKGCILVGESRISDTMIGNSRDAFEQLNAKLENAWAANEQVWLEIRDIQFVQ